MATPFFSSFKTRSWFLCPRFKVPYTKTLCIWEDWEDEVSEEVAILISQNQWAGLKGRGRHFKMASSSKGQQTETGTGTSEAMEEPHVEVTWRGENESDPEYVLNMDTFPLE